MAMKLTAEGDDRYALNFDGNNDYVSVEQEGYFSFENLARAHFNEVWFARDHIEEEPENVNWGRDGF